MPGLESDAFDSGSLPVQQREGTLLGALKRSLDVGLAATVLVGLSPVLLAIAIAVRWTSPGPALFRQSRVGRDGRPFTMYKFRTMYHGCGDDAHRAYVRRLLLDAQPAAGGPGGLYKIESDVRITRVGKFLRASSLDELPQLVNVLKGDMSLVGPRPVLAWEAELFAPQHRARFLVRPGITGLWQVSGRNRLTMLEALDLDLEYLRKRTIVLDLAILCRTVAVVLRRDGVR